MYFLVGFFLESHSVLDQTQGVLVLCFPWLYGLSLLWHLVLMDSASVGISWEASPVVVDCLYYDICFWWIRQVLELAERHLQWWCSSMRSWEKIHGKSDRIYYTCSAGAHRCCAFHERLQTETVQICWAKTIFLRQINVFWLCSITYWAPLEMLLCLPAWLPFFLLDWHLT